MSKKKDQKRAEKKGKKTIERRNQRNQYSPKPSRKREKRTMNIKTALDILAWTYITHLTEDLNAERDIARMVRTGLPK